MSLEYAFFDINRVSYEVTSSNRYRIVRIKRINQGTYMIRYLMITENVVDKLVA